MIKLWDQFFFSERPTYNLALFRIVWGCIIFFNVLFDLGNVADFYGPDAIVSFDVINSRFNQFHFSLFKVLPQSLTSTYFIYFFTLFSLFMVTIGLFTRPFLFFSLLGLISLHMRNIWLLSSADILVRCIFFILIWSPCFQVLSLDSYFAKKRGRPYPLNESQWTWRLIQIQISVLYLWTFWSKMKGEDWLDGSAVYYATRLETMRNITIPWILDSIIVLKFLTWSTLFIEFALGTLVWFKAFRGPIIFLGICLHLGIEVTMAIPFFEWLMIVLLMNFFTPEEYVGFYEKMRECIKSRCKIKFEG